MAMTTGGGGGYSSDINVTPMIDVLLVLLIIFMVIVPVTPKGLEALVPQPPKTDQPQKQSDRTIIVELLERNGGAPAYKINEKDTDIRSLQAELTGIYSNRAERVMFVTVCARVDGDSCVKGTDNVDFRYVAEVIDIARAANVDHIGLMTPKILEGK